ncbi:hypothetical protein D3C81_1770510 [compost metagenome]
MQFQPRLGGAFTDVQRQWLGDRFACAARTRQLQLRRQCQLLMVLTLGSRKALLRRLPDQAECRDAKDKHPQHQQQPTFAQRQALPALQERQPWD